MADKYKLTIYAKNLYKEIEISHDIKQFKVGTNTECDVRLRKNLFFEPFELSLYPKDDHFVLMCSPGLYITTGDARKLVTVELWHGSEFGVMYQNTDTSVFDVSFAIDFDSENKRFERVFKLPDHTKISIGSSNDCSLVLRSKFAQNDLVYVQSNGEEATLQVHSTQYGVYLNGIRVRGAETLKNGDFLSMGDYSFCYKGKLLWTEIRDDMIGQGLPVVDFPTLKSYPKFIRNTRVQLVLDDEKIEVLDPPAKPQKPRNNLLTRLIPSLGMVGISIVMALFGGYMIIFSLLSASMGIITAVVGLVQSKKDFVRLKAERVEKYTRYIENKKAEIVQCREAELADLEDLYFSNERKIQMVSDFSEDLFDRSAEDKDFLHVYLGRGKVKANRVISYKKQEHLEIEDELQLMPAQLHDTFEQIENAPVVCNLKECNAIGIYGAEQQRFSMLKNMVLDLCTRQYYSDLKLFFVASPEHKHRVWWLRFLPYVKNNHADFRNLVCNEEGKNHVFEYLYKELSTRAQTKQFTERLVVFMYDEYDFKNHPLSRFVKESEKLGVCFVFFAETKGKMAQGCNYLICLQDEHNGYLTNTQNRNETECFQMLPVEDELIHKIINYIAPVYTEEISLEGSLTRNVSLFEILDIFAVEDLNLTERWQKSKVYESMAAPLGVTKTGTVYLDLHDKAHGPHGLVAGTTGSGKSEILQSYMLSMATTFHPYELAFVVIDFKGGGMANQFRDLPHLLGAITNIDGKAIHRSLKSIKAELAKRQRLFADAEVNHIDRYIQKFKSGTVAVPLPHLIVIVDEFAELKAEQPEFMKELISAARIGRSLGVHLILATQKPSGQVNEQIWSNSRFKLCLKVQSKEDSNEVLKSPLAAEIQEPGRAYLQVGNNEVFELFQSAYSGAPEKEDENKQREFTLYSIGESGKRVPVYRQQKKKENKDSSTQLEAIIKAVASHFEKTNQTRLPDICLPELSHTIVFPAKDENKKEAGLWANLGMVDDPDNQRQVEYRMNLTEGNLLIIGSAQSGKTNLLQTVIRSLTSQYTPKELSLYIVDFASMVLKNFETLKHVGGVVTSSEDEKLMNLFKLLNSELLQRKEKLLSVGLSSYSAYLEAGKTDLPHIVVLIDNMTMLQELYFKDDDTLLYLCREGLSVGISLVVANAQMAGIGYRYKNNFSSKIALFCNDANEYSNVFDFCRERIDNIPGRCLVEISKEHFECQTYLAFEGEREIDRVEKIKTFVNESNAANKDARSANIPVIPTVLTQTFIEEHCVSQHEVAYNVALGLDYNSVSPFVVDFTTLGVLAISGKDGSGKHNFIQYVLQILDKNKNAPLKVYAMDGMKKRLAYLQGQELLASYSLMAEDAIARLYEVEQQLEKRYESLVSGDESLLQNEPFLLLLIDNPDILAAICQDTKAYDAYKNITGRLKSLRVGVIYACYENTNITYSAPEILRTMRDNRHFVYFDNMQDLKIFDVPIATMRQYKKPLELGDAYYFKGNECNKLKTPLIKA